MERQKRIVTRSSRKKSIRQEIVLRVEEQSTPIRLATADIDESSSFRVKVR